MCATVSDAPPAGGVDRSKDFPKPKLGAKSLIMIEIFNHYQETGWPEECIKWPWAEDDRRHKMYYKGNSCPVAHVALAITSGPRVNYTYQGLHSCDNKWCINAMHLRWGTEAENRWDQVKRQRGSIGKIGPAQAEEIMLRHKAFVQNLAIEYECSTSAITSIAMGKSWQPEKWIEDVR